MTSADPAGNGQHRTVVILAAGEGKRMRSALPKVLHPLLGRTLLGHVLAATEAAFPADETIVVVGHGADAVRAHLADIAPGAQAVLQPAQRGTGDAVRHALNAARAGADGTVVVLNGDIPLVRPETLRALVETHESTGAGATLMTAVVADPTGLGRIVRFPDTATDTDASGAGGGVQRIVEQRDATADERAIDEINAGAYVFDGKLLGHLLGGLSTQNDQGEEYLTDVIGLLVADNRPVEAVRVADPTEALGCNDRAELAVLRTLLRDRINTGWMKAGVTLLDPATTWIDVTVQLGTDALVEPNTQLRGTTEVGAGATVGPDSTLTDTTVGAGASVVRTHAVSARIGERAQVGPYAYLRPGSQLGTKSKVGTFVETKNAAVGAGAKVPHLSYVGDATIGEGTNIGAATVFVNYDGVDKHHTTIGAHARTGADNMFVAPVTVGDGAYTAAGSIITADVPPGALGVSRGRQRNVEGWVERRRPGTAAAEAAARAMESAGTASADETLAREAPAGEGPATARD